MSNWTLLSNHGHVLVCLSRDPEARLRDVAADVGITERAVQKIVRDLQDGGMISVAKNGRRNSYHIHNKQSLRHELEASCTLQDLIRVVNGNQQPQPPAADLGNSADADLESRPTVPDRVLTTGPESVAKPPSVKPEPVKSVADNITGKGESRPSEGLEKQQGTLF